MLNVQASAITPNDAIDQSFHRGLAAHQEIFPHLVQMHYACLNETQAPTAAVLAPPWVLSQLSTELPPGVVFVGDEITGELSAQADAAQGYGHFHLGISNPDRFGASGKTYNFLIGDTKSDHVKRVAHVIQNSIQQGRFSLLTGEDLNPESMQQAVTEYEASTGTKFLHNPQNAFKLAAVALTRRRADHVTEHNLQGNPIESFLVVEEDQHITMHALDGQSLGEDFMGLFKDSSSQLDTLQQDKELPNAIILPFRKTSSADCTCISCCDSRHRGEHATDPDNTLSLHTLGGAVARHVSGNLLPIHRFIMEQADNGCRDFAIMAHTRIDRKGNGMDACGFVQGMINYCAPLLRLSEEQRVLLAAYNPDYDGTLRTYLKPHGINLYNERLEEIEIEFSRSFAPVLEVLDFAAAEEAKTENNRNIKLRKNQKAPVSTQNLTAEIVALVTARLAQWSAQNVKELLHSNGIHNARVEAHMQRTETRQVEVFPLPCLENTHRTLTTLLESIRNPSFVGLQAPLTAQEPPKDIASCREQSTSRLLKFMIRHSEKHWNPGVNAA